MSTPQLLSGKVAIITGAASNIGKAIATRFVAHGASVVLADINVADCQQLASILNSSKAGVAEAMKCDVTVASDITKVIHKANKSFNNKDPDIFYNNAGFHDGVSSARSITDLDKAMSINVKSVLESIRQAGDVMRKNKSGCILCTGSTMGLLGDAVPSAYSISKAAVMGLVRAAAAELANDGVRVNAISPHRVESRSLDSLLLEKIFPTADTQQRLHMIENYMTKRVVKYEDVADAAVFLASDYGKSVNGHNLELSGTFSV
ncbi:hypothetical protein SETIT_8G230500v2 [Setaria italica]|uniref:Uncharacterized protein n=1 Tax=Setaria italica TaxID=4555 RepID=A0A368SAP7_SETIT|nr:short-chain dehydrogenase reductase 2a [Setaria italica]RCV39516.1 hypothetical protein SETIT_8G230500v2 [Setaria italica]